MKKIASLLLVVLLLVSLSACELPQTAGNTDGEKAQWEIFLEEYDEFVDEYVQLFRQYKENPTDLSILEDFTEASSKAEDWASRASDITKELISSPADAAKFASELLEITKKLADIAP